MLITKKMLLALTLVGALLGAGVGALITHSASNPTAAANTTADANPVMANQTANQTAKTPDQIATENSTQFKTSEEQTAYRQGFDEGYQGCASAQNNGAASRTVASSSSAPVRRYANGRAYYDYSSAPRGRTFWQKHRDKLTMGIGTGLGAAVGGIAGGGKGAGIGALAGLGGSALYTYKLRHRHQRRY